MHEIDSLRREMDRLNRQLRDLLQQRARLVLRIGRIKRKHGLRLADPARERAMLAAVLRRPGKGFDPAQLTRIFRAVFRASREVLILEQFFNFRGQGHEGR